jgi:hypothetical protein
MNSRGKERSQLRQQTLFAPSQWSKRKRFVTPVTCPQCVLVVGREIKVEIWKRQSKGLSHGFKICPDTEIYCAEYGVEASPMGSSWPRSESTLVFYASVLVSGRMLKIGFRLEPPPYNGVKLRGCFGFRAVTSSKSRRIPASGEMRYPNWSRL